MTKRFCDMCETEVSKERTPPAEYCTPDPVNGKLDESARIKIYPYTSYQGHSTGFAGPPDLCQKCYCGLIQKLLETAQA